MDPDSTAGDIDDGTGAVSVDLRVGVCGTTGAGEAPGAAIGSDVTGVVTGPPLDAGADMGSITGSGSGTVSTDS